MWLNLCNLCEIVNFKIKFDGYIRSEVAIVLYHECLTLKTSGQ